jgi:carbonic anhydrase/acetyltransferase-like protein (isoleucine patch superfamily)
MDGAVILSGKSPQPGFDASTYIASNVHIGSRSLIKNCTIMDNVMIGNGAVVLEGALLEEGAVVEAGSVVPAGARVPSNEVWGGNPLKFIRTLDKKELDNPVYAGRELWALASVHKDEQLPSGQAYIQAEKAGL